MSKEEPSDEEISACIQLIVNMLHNYKITRSVGINAMLSLCAHELSGRETQMMQENLNEFCMHVFKSHKAKNIDIDIDQCINKLSDN